MTMAEYEALLKNPSTDRRTDLTYKAGDIVRVKAGDKFVLFRVSQDCVLDWYDCMPGDFIEPEVDE